MIEHSDRLATGGHRLGGEPLFRQVVTYSKLTLLSIVMALPLGATGCAPTQVRDLSSTRAARVYNSNSTENAKLSFETKLAFAEDLAQTFGCQPAPGGQSSFQDVPTGSPEWGWARLGLKLGIVQPDSGTQFGLGDPVTWQDVTSASIKYLHVPLSHGTTAFAWAKQEQLYPGGQSASQMQLSAKATHRNVVAFLTRLKSLADLLKPMPNSWTLHGVEAGLLTRALTNTEKSSFGQSTSLVSIRVAAQANGSDPNGKIAELAALNHVQQLRIVTLTAVDSGHKESYIVMTPVGSSAGGTVVREYLLGSTLYIDSGDGWHQLTVSSDQQLPMEPQMPDVRLGQISHVTAEKAKSGYVFRGNLQTAGLVNLIQPLIASITMQPHAAMMSRSQPVQSPFEALLQHMNANFAVGVTMQSGKPYVTQQSASLYMNIPPDVLFGGSSGSFNDIANLRFEETVTTTSTFHTTLALPPSDLRALLKQSQSGHGSQGTVLPSSGDGSSIT